MKVSGLQSFLTMKGMKFICKIRMILLRVRDCSNEYQKQRISDVILSLAAKLANMTVKGLSSHL